MKVRDLSTSLKGKKSGWVAINKKNQVVVTASSFSAINKKIEHIKEEVVLVPAAKDYSGYIS